jgi:Predicted thioesterase
MSAPFPEPSCWLAHRVSYGETDAMGVVYYANYLHLFERGRGELIRGLGFSYATVEERGIFLRSAKPIAAISPLPATTRLSISIPGWPRSRGPASALSTKSPTPTNPSS